MRKKNLYKNIIIIMLSFFIILGCVTPYFALDNPEVVERITQKELCEVFPEYEAKIKECFENGQKQIKTKEMQERVVENVVQKTLDNGSSYAVVFYEGVGLAAARINFQPSLTGGTISSTSTKYVRTNATVLATEITYGNTASFSLAPVSFTINKNSYDKLDSCSDYVLVNQVVSGEVVNSQVRYNSKYLQETSSYLAGIHFYAGGSYFAFEVGKNVCKVTCSGSVVTVLAPFN